MKDMDKKRDFLRRFFSGELAPDDLKKMSTESMKPFSEMTDEEAAEEAEKLRARLTWGHLEKTIRREWVENPEAMRRAARSLYSVTTLEEFVEAEKEMHAEARRKYPLSYDLTD